MAITHTTLLNNGDFPEDNCVSIYNTLLTAYDWENSSTVNVGENIQTTYGRYYFTENSYIQIGVDFGGLYYVKITIVTPNGTKEFSPTHSGHISYSYGKTSKGIGILAYSLDGGTRDIMFYNLYIGEITKLDGSITKGCIYAADDGTLTIATDDGISSEKAQTSTINADRTAILTPVVDTTYGNVFKDIYFMRSSPLNYNIMAVEGQGNFLCGKTLCLKDQEVEA